MVEATQRGSHTHQTGDNHREQEQRAGACPYEAYREERRRGWVEVQHRMGWMGAERRMGWVGVERRTRWVQVVRRMGSRSRGVAVGSRTWLLWRGVG